MPVIKNLPFIGTATENTLLLVEDVDRSPETTSKMSFDQLRDYFLGYVGSGDRRGYTGSRGSGYTGSRGFRGLLGYDGSRGFIGSASTIRGYTGSRGFRGYTGSVSPEPSYLHTQTTATSTWVVTHSLGTKYVHVNVITTGSESLLGTYDYPTVTFNTINQLTLDFAYSISGYAAILSGGGLIGYVGSRGFTGNGSQIATPTVAGAVYGYTTSSNAFLGYNAGNESLTGINNVGIGAGALQNITTGSYNVGLGGYSGAAITTSSRNVIISDGAGTIKLAFTASGAMSIGNSITNVGAAGAVLTSQGPGTSPTWVGSMAKTNTAQTFTAGQAGYINTVTDMVTITLNFASANNFQVTLGASRTLANPTNVTPGQSGVITIIQGGSGSYTLSYGSNWKFSGNTDPNLSTTATSIDLLAYYVVSPTAIAGRLIPHLL